MKAELQFCLKQNKKELIIQASNLLFCYRKLSYTTIIIMIMITIIIIIIVIIIIIKIITIIIIYLHLQVLFRNFINFNSFNILLDTEIKQLKDPSNQILVT